MIFARKVDNNQKDIVDRLRALHCQVEDISRMGKGWPDLLVNFCGRTFLIEVKSANGKLTRPQVEFHERWIGEPLIILRTLRDAECFVMRVRNAIPCR